MSEVNETENKIVKVKAYNVTEAKRKAKRDNPSYTPKRARWDKPSLKDFNVMMTPRKTRKKR